MIQQFYLWAPAQNGGTQGLEEVVAPHVQSSMTHNC